MHKAVCRALQVLLPTTLLATITGAPRLTGGTPQADATGTCDVVPSNMSRISQIVGEYSAWTPSPTPPLQNDTSDLYNVGGADLGIPWDDGAGHTLIAFGDTFGSGWTGPGAQGPSWRSQTAARSSDTNLSDGLTFSSMITRDDGTAKELFGSKKIDNDEISTIPTSAISIGSTQYIQFMSVYHWGGAPGWETNYSEFAKSTDDGQTWSKQAGARWTNNASWSDPFQQTALVNGGDGYIYMFGTPNGRSGSVSVARVAPANILSPGNYKYWDGSTWQATEGNSAAVVPAPVGEMSVQRNAGTGCWLMTYTDQTTANKGIVLRSADGPTGPWSGPHTLVPLNPYVGTYGGFMHPWSSGNDLYFTESEYSPYAVYLWHANIANS